MMIDDDAGEAQRGGASRLDTKQMLEFKDQEATLEDKEYCRSIWKKDNACRTGKG